MKHKHKTNVVYEVDFTSDEDTFKRPAPRAPKRPRPTEWDEERSSDDWHAQQNYTLRRRGNDTTAYVNPPPRVDSSGFPIADNSPPPPSPTG